MTSKPTRFYRAFPLFACVSSAVALVAPKALAETWNHPGSATAVSYNTAGNWNPASIPNSVGANAIFNGAATALNVEQTANHLLTLDGPKTLGSILFNTDLGAFTNSIATGTGGPLTFDEAGEGPAIITTQGIGTGNNTISVGMTLTDTLVGVVNNTTASSAAGSLNLTGTMNGAGGFIKNGDGLATFGTGAKTYTGPTILNGGRMRISMAARPQNTSSFTINSGAQLDSITAGTYSFGTGILTLNGNGATSGPFAIFPGAIRQDTNLDITITNEIVLQTDTLLHVQGSASGFLRLPGNIGGPGRLTLTAPNSDLNLGTLVLGGNNTYAGGTTVNGGRLLVSGVGARLGLGLVEVRSANAMFAGASARLTIETGVLDAIADTATLSLAGGNLFGLADDGFIELQFGVNEKVGGLMLAGLSQPEGTYGATGSGATFTNDEFFSGPGIVTVVPEPGLSAMFLTGFSAIFGIRRNRPTRLG